MGNSQPKENLAQADGTQGLSPVDTRHKIAFQYLLQTTSASSGSVNSDKVITTDIIKSHIDIDGCEYGRYFVQHVEKRLARPPYVSEDEFLHIGAELADLGQRPTAIIEYYTEAFTCDKNELSRNDVSDVVEVAFCAWCAVNRMTLDRGHSEEAGRTQFRPVIDSILSREESVARSVLVSWIQRHCCRLLSSVHHWTVDRWRTPAPYTTHTESCGADECDRGMTRELKFLLSATLPLVYLSADSELNGQTGGLSHWLLLYDSNNHGLSINRFEHHVFSYRGPTVTMISFEDHVYLIAAEEEWRDSIDRWGGPNCIMLELAPKYKIIQGGAPMCFLNLSSRSVRKGFQFGKDSRSVMLEVDDEMTRVTHYGIEKKLDRVQTWGCGSRQVREAQLEQKQWEKNEVEKHKNRKLKLEDWKDSPDRMLLEMGGVKVTHSEEHPNE